MWPSMGCRPYLALQVFCLLLALASVRQAHGQLQLLADGFNMVSPPQLIHRATNVSQHAAGLRQLNVQEVLPLVEDYIGLEVSKQN